MAGKLTPKAVMEILPNVLYVSHWYKECPHKIDDSDGNQVKLILFSKKVYNCYINKFVRKTFNHAVLDSGCTKTVYRESWLNNYIDTLSAGDRQKVIESKSDTKFKFRDSNTVQVTKEVEIPVQIGNKQVDIHTDVINNELPLLLSKDAMKKADTTDFTKDKVKILGQEMDMKFTSSGHYLIPISKSYEVWNEFDENNSKSMLLSIENISNRTTLREKQSIAEKSHKQFGHASSDKTLKLIKLSGIVDKELDLVNEIGEKCTMCLKYKKAPLKPVVGFSLSRDFNKVISVDSKEINGFKILHLIDHTTRYSAATIVKSKQKEEIVKAIFRIWITLFGPPNEILSDNGGEFNNDLLRDLSDQLNVFIRTTPGESPWSNGITERHNAILRNTINKLLIDNSNNYSVDIIVAWAVSAKNALHNYYGFSPYHLVICKNPALEGKTSSEIIANHLNAMHAARKVFIEAEASEKLRRAIKAKTRVSTGIIYQPGYIVYYKRNDSSQWKGPVTVLAHENKQILMNKYSSKITFVKSI